MQLQTSTTRTQGIFIVFLLFCGHLLNAQSEAPEAFKIYDSKQAKEISMAELVSSTIEADVLFFGEEHDDALAHWVQDTLYGLLLERYESVTLSMEMFETDVQLVLDEYLAGHITKDKFLNDSRPWNNYADAYASMVERAKDKGQKVVAANAPRRYVNLVSREGKQSLEALPKTSKTFLPPLPIYTQDTAYQRRFDEIMGGAGHGMSPTFFEAQCTWDAGMANSIYQAWKQEKKTLIYHLNGSFHTNYQHGTMHQLQRRNKKLTLENISCLNVEDFNNPDWSKYSDLGDYVIISAKNE